MIYQIKLTPTEMYSFFIEQKQSKRNLFAVVTIKLF